MDCLDCWVYVMTIDWNLQSIVGKVVAELTLLNLKLNSDVLYIYGYWIGEDDHKIFKVSVLQVCRNTNQINNSLLI